MKSNPDSATKKTAMKNFLFFNDFSSESEHAAEVALLLAGKTGANLYVWNTFDRYEKPVEKELAVLTKYYDQQAGTIDEQNAHKMLSVGEYRTTGNIDQKKMAAMMRVIAMIYNLEETITKS